MISSAVQPREEVLPNLRDGETQEDRGPGRQVLQGPPVVSILRREVLRQRCPGHTSEEGPFLLSLLRS